MITTDVIKLTMHNTVDARLVAILAAMPKGHKARLVADAILAQYDVDATGALQMKTTNAPSSSVAAPAQDEPQQQAPAPAAKPKQPKQPPKVEVETF